MRDIKFRGKRLDNGKWICGSLVTYGNQTFIWEIFPEGYITEAQCKRLFSETFVEVDPETVGQYTCRKDKNGKETYEWDKLQDSTDDVGTIYWKENIAGFYCKWGDGSDMPLNCGVAVDKCEVIGNATKNP